MDFLLSTAGNARSGVAITILPAVLTKSRLDSDLNLFSAIVTHLKMLSNQYPRNICLSPDMSCSQKIVLLLFLLKLLFHRECPAEHSE